MAEAGIADVTSSVYCTISDELELLELEWDELLELEWDELLLEELDELEELLLEELDELEELLLEELELELELDELELEELACVMGLGCQLASLISEHGHSMYQKTDGLLLLHAAHWLSRKILEE